MKLWLSVSAVAAAVSLCACAGVSPPTTPTSLAAADARLPGTAFDPAFYRAFVQNGYESPHRLEPVRRLPGPPRLYLRTVDDSGHEVDAATLALTERVLADGVRAWSGGRFGMAEVVRGTGTRERVPGWLTITWTGRSASDRCGRSTVGIDGGFIEFNLRGACSCGTALRVYPRLVRHELGHAMGYYHTDGIDDVMYGQTVASASCDLRPSEREARHAGFLYGDSR